MTKDYSKTWEKAYDSRFMHHFKKQTLFKGIKEFIADTLSLQRAYILDSLEGLPTFNATDDFGEFDRFVDKQSLDEVICGLKADIDTTTRLELIYGEFYNQTKGTK